MIIAAAGLCACATVARPGLPAVLVDASSPELREAVRLFVRDAEGRGVLADVDSLLSSPELVVRQRDVDAFDGPANLRVPARYTLETGPDGTCVLQRDGERADRLQLPRGTRCEPLDRVSD